MVDLKEWATHHKPLAIAVGLVGAAGLFAGVQRLRSGSSSSSTGTSLVPVAGGNVVDAGAFSGGGIYFPPSTNPYDTPTTPAPGQTSGPPSVGATPSAPAPNTTSAPVQAPLAINFTPAPDVFAQPIYGGTYGGVGPSFPNGIGQETIRNPVSSVIPTETYKPSPADIQTTQGGIHIIMSAVPGVAGGYYQTYANDYTDYGTKVVPQVSKIVGEKYNALGQVVS